PTPSPAIYTLSLHDALPISKNSRESLPQNSDRGTERKIQMYFGSKIFRCRPERNAAPAIERVALDRPPAQILSGPAFDDFRVPLDRKSTRLNSSHLGISYAV